MGREVPITQLRWGAMLSLLIMMAPLLRSTLISFIGVLKLSVYGIYICFAKGTPIYLIFFGLFPNGIVFLTLISIVHG